MTATPRAEIKAHGASGPSLLPSLPLSLCRAGRTSRKTSRLSEEAVNMADTFQNAVFTAAPRSGGVWGLFKHRAHGSPPLLKIGEPPKEQPNSHGELEGSGEAWTLPFSCSSPQPRAPSLACGGGGVPSRLPVLRGAAVGAGPGLLWVLGLVPLPLWDPGF